MPGGQINSPNGTPRKLSGQISWRSHHPINRVELIHNGSVAQRKDLNEAPQQNGEWGFDLEIEADGWIAARAYGDARDSFAQAIYAHTSPVQIGTGSSPRHRTGVYAAFFVRSIDDSIDWINRSNSGRSCSPKGELPRLCSPRIQQARFRAGDRSSFHTRHLWSERTFVNNDRRTKNLRGANSRVIVHLLPSDTVINRIEQQLKRPVRLCAMLRLEAKQNHMPLP